MAVDKTVKKNNSGYIFQFNDTKYGLASRTHIMGILNVTPDSFSDGGKYYDTDEAVERGIKLAEEGADFIDVGGESTRPGSESVSVEEEIRRVIPVIEKLARQVCVPISIDTYKADTAEAALEAGAIIINDVSAMTYDAKMISTAVKHNASVILMHMKGAPRTMQENPVYDNVTEEVKKYLGERMTAVKDAGIKQVIVDPGIGFGKKFEHNIQLMQELRSFLSLGCPLLLGPSRKSFIGAILNLPADERIEGTAAAVTSCIMNGANIIRVHDVKEMKRVAMVADALISDYKKVD
ncbi:MAG: dihydropteroate synthase [Bacteroidetes bacterium]|nr:dihydropteroate synthase [Bacteroidota bacterium]